HTHSSLIMPPPPSPTLFPYTTLFRSLPAQGDLHGVVHRHDLGRGDDAGTGMLQALEGRGRAHQQQLGVGVGIEEMPARGQRDLRDRKSTRLNSSHVKISYAVFCLKKK